MDVFRSHPWPGNVRELEHAIEHAVILCQSEIISRQDLPQDLLDTMQCSNKSVTAIPATSLSPQNNLTLEEAMVMAGGNKTHAARLLGISRRTVYRHLDT